MFMVVLDSTALNVALPSMERELHASVSGMQWAVASYSVVVASLLTLAGSTADRIGRRCVFRAGLAVFTAGSLVSGLAPALGALVGGRMIQGVGGAMLVPVSLSIIVNTFSDGRERARAIGVWTSVTGIGAACPGGRRRE
ncbi:MFS transporter [Streptomyces sp. I05A-00742]|uniref:MFS transporter n=1 Tax=Streptomyces sp. I05A-00742 TaxID=2732853 RepID=UPI00289C3537|nr:MFS transporter [Streptomyces sp. I05A-00742]